MVNLIIDFGNTRTKAAIFDDKKLVETHGNINITGLRLLIDQYRPNYLMVSSVSTAPDKIKAELGQDIFFLTHQTAVPFHIDYKTPETLGLDRIAAVAGAQALFPNQNCLVIDTGTCITYDFLDQDGHHLGGSITPGINMRFKAMHTFTANLPLLNFEKNVDLVGKTTKEAMQSGVLYGIIGEINEIIRRYEHKFATLQIIICGGDAKSFENKLKADIFASPELVLIGLNRILLYNV
ncbi:MAG: type III pantothenate kinase [Fulvivirga sp.]|nr:type III pantothenate kinase [Fulvivirga sp.]